MQIEKCKMKWRVTRMEKTRNAVLCDAKHDRHESKHFAFCSSHFYFFNSSSPDSSMTVICQRNKTDMSQTSRILYITAVASAQAKAGGCGGHKAICMAIAGSAPQRIASRETYAVGGQIHRRYFTMRGAPNP